MLLTHTPADANAKSAATSPGYSSSHWRYHHCHPTWTNPRSARAGPCPATAISISSALHGVLSGTFRPWKDASRRACQPFFTLMHSAAARPLLQRCHALGTASRVLACMARQYAGLHLQLQVLDARCRRWPLHLYASPTSTTQLEHGRATEGAPDCPKSCRVGSAASENAQGGGGASAAGEGSS